MEDHRSPSQCLSLRPPPAHSCLCISWLLKQGGNLQTRAQPHQPHHSPTNGPNLAPLKGRSPRVCHSRVFMSGSDNAASFPPPPAPFHLATGTLVSLCSFFCDMNYPLSPPARKGRPGLPNSPMIEINHPRMDGCFLPTHFQQDPQSPLTWPPEDPHGQAHLTG